MDDKPRYCVCRSTDAKSFMIACDKCEEWFHGKCIKVTPEAASHIRRYYCSSCQTDDPSLKIKYKKTKHDDSSDEPPSKRKVSNAKPLKKSSRQCGTCEGCKRLDDCGTCDFCRDMRKFGGPNRIRQKCRHRQCKDLGIKKDLDKLSDNSPADTVMPPKKKAAPSPKSAPQSKSKKPAAQTGTKATKARKPYTRKKQDENVSIKDQLKEVTPRQCYGPRCIKAARVGSKYCSDECGMKLAAMRLVEIMPTRISQWQSTPCVAEQNNRKQLDEIREKMLEAKRHLEELDEKRKVIDKIVERAKQEKVKEEESEEEKSDSDDEDVEEDMELFVYCVTCGHEVNQRNAIKHMEKCFIKAERDMSFAGSFKSIIGGDVICDHYNASSRSYCKRLKVICPEHSKEPKVADDEICGCPLTKELFTETSELCKNAKKHCADHFKWERLRRAEIDADKVRQWMKIDELLERERLIRAAMSNRAGVMGLLLHQTVDHDAIQSHHKHHTPMKPESKTACVKTTAPSSANVKDLSKIGANDGTMAIDTKEKTKAEASNTTDSPTSATKQQTFVNKSGPVTDTKSHNTVTVSVKAVPATSKPPTIISTQSQSNDHGYSKRQPAPSQEHDYC